VDHMTDIAISHCCNGET